MLTAADVMTADVISVAPDTPVRDIAALLYTHRISGVPVVDETGGVIGIVSEGDLIGHATIVGERRRSWWLSLFADEDVSARDYVKTHGRTARDVMTTNVVTVEETATLADLAEIFERHRIKRVPVVRGGKLVGIVTRGNLLRGFTTPAVEPPSSLNDQAIREQLLAALEDQPWAHLLDIVVENGVIHLHGTVQTEVEATEHFGSLQKMPGVKNVEFHLTP